MDNNWMGRYRSLVAALVLHANVVNKALTEKHDISDGIMLTTQEWQIFEYIVEHREEFMSMIEISKAIGIPQSSFSRMVSSLEKHALVEKYQVSGNMKNIVLRPSEYGLKLFANNPRTVMKPIFEEFFKDLDSITDEDLDTFVSALNRFTRKLPSADYSQNIKLVKLKNDPTAK